jgi:hypothetical protein
MFKELYASMVHDDDEELDKELDKINLEVVQQQMQKADPIKIDTIARNPG